MPKRKVLRKRRRIQPKRSSDIIKRPDITKMSRLEYEQSMTDPKFRALVAGLGLGPPQVNPQIQSRMDEMSKQIQSNNQMTNQLTQLTEVGNLSKKNAQLKAELKSQKEANKSEIQNRINRCADRN